MRAKWYAIIGGICIGIGVICLPRPTYAIVPIVAFEQIDAMAAKLLMLISRTAGKYIALANNVKKSVAQGPVGQVMQDPLGSIGLECGTDELVGTIEQNAMDASGWTDEETDEAAVASSEQAASMTLEEEQKATQEAANDSMATSLAVATAAGAQASQFNITRVEASVEIELSIFDLRSALQSLTRMDRMILQQELKLISLVASQINMEAVSGLNIRPRLDNTEENASDGKESAS